MDWHDVPSLQGYYQVTRDGRVRSVSRRINSPQSGGTRWLNGRELKARVGVNGYVTFDASVRGKSAPFYLHRAIAEVFIPNPECKPEINHKDGDRANNAINNLEWCTRQENMAHAFDTGLVPPSAIGPGEDGPAAKLTNTNVATIKKRLQSGDRQIDIANDYGVTKGTIGHIAYGRTWAHIEAAQ